LIEAELHKLGLLDYLRAVCSSAGRRAGLEFKRWPSGGSNCLRSLAPIDQRTEIGSRPPEFATAIGLVNTVRFNRNEGTARLHQTLTKRWPASGAGHNSHSSARISTPISWE
jgi:hypothetical protein